MPTLNLGILAHVDAGKTSLTERLLFEAGVLDRVGSVDAGTTLTDSMDLERRRGITIRSAVTSFESDGVTVNLLDTPGHPDFIAEVQRALTVLDGAVLVLSAVEGVQPQTVVLWRALCELDVPTVVFVNKVDRAGAGLERVVAEIRERLAPHAVVLSTVIDEQTRAAVVRRVALGAPRVLEDLADSDAVSLTAWADGRSLPDDALLDRIRTGVADGSTVPILAGSALTGAGVADLMSAVTRLLPPDDETTARPSRGPSASGVVFAVDRDAAGRRVFVRMWAGEVRVRDRLQLTARADPADQADQAGRPAARRRRVTGLSVPRSGELVAAESVTAGQIGVLRGVEARIGDTFGPAGPRRHPAFAPPTAEAVVEPVRPEDRGAVFAALTELAASDPLIALRSDDAAQEMTVRLFGEVQKEVLASLLAEEHGLEVRFRETTLVYVERLAGTGAARDEIQVGDNPYLATVGLRVEPGRRGSGIAFELGVERGSMPPAFFVATELGVRAALRQGLAGWEVTDAVVTMTDAGYWARQGHAHQKFNKAFSSVAGDFRNLAQVVVMEALQQARTTVCEPVDRIDLEVPLPVLGATVALVGRLGGQVLTTEPGSRRIRLIAHLPATARRGLSSRLPDLAGGEAVLVTVPDHHRPMTTSSPPSRRWVGPDPRDRETWFRERPR